MDKIYKDTIQEFPDAKKNNGAWEYQWYLTGRGPLLPAWGTRERERQLRQWYRNEYNNIGQDAISGLVKKIQSTQWNVKGKRGAEHFHELLMNAEFKKGWGKFISMLVTDFARQDLGSFVEIIAPGNPLKPPTGKVTGIATLDTLRCYPTGDPEYPVVYMDRLSKLHLMHNTRVYQFVDMIDKDDYNPGYGLCALSRAIKVVNEQAHMARYISTQLDDQPAPGILVASNISEAKMKAILADYSQKQTSDAGTGTLGRQVVISSLDTANPAKIESVTWHAATADWDYEKYNNIHVNAWAAALGVDVQEIWQLTGGNIGSAGQSEVLHSKSQGRTYGALLTEIERFINQHVLPPNLEFEFKRRDAQEAMTEADIAHKWTTALTAAGANITPDEYRRILASQVEPIKDGITDEKGEIETLPDNDVGPNDGGTGDVTLDGNGGNGAGNQQVIDDTESKMLYITHDSGKIWSIESKAIQSTRLDFEGAFEDVLIEARAGSITKARFSTLLRGLIARYGKAAYRDGLIDGGVTDGALDSDDDAAVSLLLAEQSPYVRSFAGTLYEMGISDGEAALKPEMWYNKSISVFYDRGRLSADRNGNYVWVRSAVSDSCKDCIRLNGQVHRLRDWSKKGWLVKSSRLACRGFNCHCVMVRTTEKARGRF